MADLKVEKDTEKDLEKHSLTDEEKQVTLETVQNPDDIVASGNFNVLTEEWLNHPAHPRFWPQWKRWGIACVYAVLQIFVMMTSTSYIAAETQVEPKFGTSPQVAALGQSMFIAGNAVGAAFLGPLSDVSGRKWAYVGSIFIYALLNIGAALPMNFPMLAIFMFLMGTAGSTSCSNVAGTISDLFAEYDMQSQGMALFVFSADAGPAIGSPVGEWIVENANMGMSWIFWINLIVAGVFSVVLCFMPETLPAIVIGGKYGSDVVKALGANKTASETVKEIYFVFTMALKIMVYEPIVLSLAIFNGFAYGLLFLYLDGIFDAYLQYNWTPVSADLTFLNALVGVAIAFCVTPFQTWLYKKDAQRHGKGRPEARFLLSLGTVWFFPLGLLWFAFTCDGKINPWSSIVAGGVFGIGDPLLWLSMLSYISDTYPTVTGSAIAAFLVPSFGLAAGFVHVGLVLFERMGIKWGYATLGFVSFSLPALTYIIYFGGPWLRRHSVFAFRRD